MLNPAGLSVEILAGLVVLAVLGLTVLALMHPARYHQVGRGLAICFLALFAAGVGWNLAITAAIEAVPLSQNGFAIIGSLDTLRTPRWIVFSLLGVALYLWALPLVGDRLNRGSRPQPG